MPFLTAAKELAGVDGTELVSPFEMQKLSVLHPTWLHTSHA